MSETPAPNQAPAAPAQADSVAGSVADTASGIAANAAVQRPPAGHASSLPARWVATGAAVLAAGATAALVLAWNTQQRVKALEFELVKRQQDSGSQATEARTLARQAEAVAREAGAKMALLEARVAETSLQRSQFEDLIQSMARSRDENVLADIDAGIRVALQQAAITGSAEPLVVTLKQTDERLARYNQPRLERVRRAVVQDLERTRSAGITDISVLTIRLDDVIRQVDDLPLLSAPERGAAARPASAPAEARDGTATGPSWARSLGGWWQDYGLAFWSEVKSLVRVTRIDHPDAMLIAPEQAYFLRESLKLRLLNARLALLSRQFDTAQADLRDAQAALDRYFDRSSRRVVSASDLLRQVAAQARLVGPDGSLYAHATTTCLVFEMPAQSRT